MGAEIPLYQQPWVLHGLAALGLSAGVGGLFVLFAAAGYNEELSKWKNFRFARVKRDWPVRFGRAFDGLFGSEHLSWRCFRTSVAVSLLFTVLVALFWRAKHPAVAGWYETGPGLPATIVGAVAMFLVFNALPDYVSLLETRWIIRHLEGLSTLADRAVLLLIDSLLTGLIWLVPMVSINVLGDAIGLDRIFDAALPSMHGWFLPRSEVGGAVVDSVLMPFLSDAPYSAGGVFFYTTLFTSFWWWLWLVSEGLLTIALAVDPIWRWIHTRGRPIQAMGLLAAGAVLAVYGVVAFAW